MQLNKTKSKIRRSLGGGGLNTSVAKVVIPRFSSETQTKNFFMKSKPNFFTTIKPHFSAELFSDTRLRQEPPAGCKNGDWLVPAEGRVVPVPFFVTAVQRSCRQKKPLKLVPACIKQGSPRGENAIMRNEPNFNSKTPTLTHEITKIYSRIHRNHHPKNEPKANPIRTQYEPNTNPIRTQYGPNSNPNKPKFWTQFTKYDDIIFGTVYKNVSKGHPA